MINKFIDTLNISDWEVESSDGTWNDIEAIGKTIEYQIYVVKTNSFTLRCADEHIIINENNQEVLTKNLNVGDKIKTIIGVETVLSIEITDEYENMYDLQLGSNTNRLYYTNGILSHNSMWMQNIAANVANQGRNVAYITLEMSSKKVMKRLGAMRLKIPIKEYDDISKDTVTMKNKINQLKKTTSTGLFGEGAPGKIFVKKFHTGVCTITDLDLYLTKLMESKKLHIDLVIVDYINLMGIEKHNKDIKSNLYQKGKHLAEGLRYIGDKHNTCVISVTQVDRSVWGANDLSLDAIPESKAIAETCDSAFAIIRNTEMRKHNKYKLKLLKLRDGENNNEIIEFDFNTTYLNIENDVLHGPSS